MFEHFLGELLEYETGGFTVLEWCGAVAVIVVGVAALAILFSRTRGFSPDLSFRYRADRPRSPTPRARREKVLVVDADPTVREAMERILSKLGYGVAHAGSGEEAVDYMTRNGADLIVMDSLTGQTTDGTATCRRIRALRPLQRIIMVSAYATPESVAAVRNLGVEHYLIKPVPLPIFEQALRSELDRP
jgi:CheY-like chemotaxis protein